MLRTLASSFMDRPLCAQVCIHICAVASIEYSLRSPDLINLIRIHVHNYSRLVYTSIHPHTHAICRRD